MGHRARGLQRRREGLGVLSARPRALTRLPLERRRPGRRVRPRAAPVPGPRLLERARPVPEGAHLRLDRPRGQPRRGRQGVLVVRGRDAHRLLAALALPLPPGGVPLRAAARGERPARPGGPGVRARRHRRLRRRPLLADHRRLREGVATRPLPADPRPQRRARGRRAPRAADVVDAEPLVLGGGAATAGDPRASGRAGRGERQSRGRGPRAVAARRGPRPRGAGAAAALLRERDERRAPLRAARADTVPQGRHQRPRGRRRRDRQSGRDTGRRSPPGTASAFRPERPSSSASGWPPTTPRARPTSARRSRGLSPAASGRPTRTTRSCGPPARPTTRRP